MKTATKAGTEFLRQAVIDPSHIFLEALENHTIEELYSLRNLLKTYEQKLGTKPNYSELGISTKGFEFLNENTMFLTAQIFWKLIVNPLLSIGLYTYAVELMNIVRGSSFCGWRILCEKAVLGDPMSQKGMFGIVLNSVMFIVQVWWAFVECWATYSECTGLQKDWETIQSLTELRDTILNKFKRKEACSLKDCEQVSGWAEAYKSIYLAGKSPELNLGEIDVYITKQILRLRRTEQRKE